MTSAATLYIKAKEIVAKAFLRINQSAIQSFYTNRKLYCWVLLKIPLANLNFPHALFIYSLFTREERGRSVCVRISLVEAATQICEFCGRDLMSRRTQQNQNRTPRVALLLNSSLWQNQSCGENEAGAIQLDADSLSICKLNYGWASPLLPMQMHHSINCGQQQCIYTTAPKHSQLEQGWRGCASHWLSVDCIDTVLMIYLGLNIYVYCKFTN